MKPQESTKLTREEITKSLSTIKVKPLPHNKSPKQIQKEIKVIKLTEESEKINILRLHNSMFSKHSLCKPNGQEVIKNSKLFE